MKRKFAFSFLLVCVALLAFVGCPQNLVTVTSKSADNGNGITVKKIQDGYVYLEMDLHSTVMKQLEANRSILPEVGTLYYTVVGTYTAAAPAGADQKCLDAIAGYTGAADTALAFTDSTTGIARLKMRVGGYWGISVIGTTVDYSTTTDYYTSNSTYWDDSDAAHTYSDTQAVTLALAGKAVNAYKLFYINADGEIKDGNATTTDANTTFTVSTSTNGVGEISLPVICEVGSDEKTIASYRMAFAAIANGGAAVPSDITGTVTEDTEFTISATDVPAGTYDVQIFFYSVAVANQSIATEVYTHTETLTVWAGQTSKWINSSSTGPQYAEITGSPNYLRLEVTPAMRTGIRSVFYVAGTSPTTLSYSATRPDGTAADGSIFYPFNSFASAYSAITAVGYENMDYLIVLDGTLSESLTYALDDTRSCEVTILGMNPSNADSFTSLTKTGNSKLTLKNITITGDVDVNEDLLYLDNAVLNGTTTLKTSTVNSNQKYPIYVSGEDTVSTATLAWQGSRPAYNTVLVKHIEDTNATDNGRLTAAHEDLFKLDNTYSVNEYNRALDALATSASYGDIILKRVTSITISDGSTTEFVLASSSSVSTLDVTAAQVSISLTFTSTIQDGSANTTTETITAIDAKVFTGSADITNKFTITPGSGNKTITVVPTAAFVTLAQAQQSVETYTVTVDWTYNDRSYSGSYIFTVTPN